MCKGLTLTRTGAGLYTLQFTGVSNVSNSVPNYLRTDGYVVSPAGTIYQFVVLSETASTGTVLVKFAVAGAATDPIANETMVLETSFSDSGQP